MFAAHTNQHRHWNCHRYAYPHPFSAGDNPNAHQHTASAANRNSNPGAASDLGADCHHGGTANTRTSCDNRSAAANRRQFFSIEIIIRPEMFF
jgi:hypothetical protein